MEVTPPSLHHSGLFKAGTSSRHLWLTATARQHGGAQCFSTTEQAAVRCKGELTTARLHSASSFHKLTVVGLLTAREPYDSG